jgi:hypothetical protein
MDVDIMPLPAVEAANANEAVLLQQLEQNPAVVDADNLVAALEGLLLAEKN